MTEFEKAANDQGITPGRFGRWALEDAERLAGSGRPGRADAAT
ncbi:hypothetical protein [Streptomyces sp. Ag109_O5-1]|nr:hypothetical protein [Streptomyces sp. Ag109_O5-1]